MAEYEAYEILKAYSCFLRIPQHLERAVKLLVYAEKKMLLRYT